MRTIEEITRAGRIDPRTGARKAYKAWRVTVTLPNGKRRSKVYRSKKAAEAVNASNAREREGGAAFVSPDKTLGTFADRAQSVAAAINTKHKAEDNILPEFKASICHGLRPSAIDDYTDQLQRLSRHFGGRRLRSITASDLEAFRDAELKQIRARDEQRLNRALARAGQALAWAVRARVDTGPYQLRCDAIRQRLATVDRAGQRTVGKCVAMARRLLSWAAARQYVLVNPALAVRKPRKQPRVERASEEATYNAAEAEALLAAAPAGWERVALAVLIYGGLRIGELRGLCWSDWEPTSGRLHVTRAADGEGKLVEPKTPAARRLVPLTASLVTDLKRWRLACPPSPLKLMFPNGGGRPLDYFNFAGRVYRRAQRRAGLRSLPLHNLRHTAASLWIAAGIDLPTVSRQLGHSNLAITLAVYSHYFERRSEADPAAKLAAFLERERAAVSGGPGGAAEDCSDLLRNAPTAA